MHDVIRNISDFQTSPRPLCQEADPDIYLPSLQYPRSVLVCLAFSKTFAMKILIGCVEVSTDINHIQ